MIRVVEATFVTTAVAPGQYPPGGLPEIAFVGRSNVGKSSMINTLAARRNLVRVSNTPGRTRTLNFFDVTVEQDRRRMVVRLCDLPGYGFAKASKGDRKQWREMISRYLEDRQELRAVVAIIDGEVGPTSDDLQTLDYLAQKVPRILVVATKLDRLPKSKRKPATKGIAERLELPLEAVVPFSAVEKFGVEEVWEALLGVAGSAAGDEIP